MQTSMLLCGWLPVVSPIFAYVPQTQGACYYKNQASILLKELCGICMMTCEQMCLPTPRSSETGMLAEISCHVFLLPTPLLMFGNECFWDWKTLFGTSLLLEFPPAYQNFYITRRKLFTVKFLVLLQTNRKKEAPSPSRGALILAGVSSVLSSLALESGPCQSISLFFHVLGDLCLICPEFLEMLFETECDMKCLIGSKSPAFSLSPCTCPFRFTLVIVQGIFKINSGF